MILLDPPLLRCLFLRIILVVRSIDSLPILLRLLARVVNRHTTAVSFLLLPVVVHVSTNTRPASSPSLRVVSRPRGVSDPLSFLLRFLSTDTRRRLESRPASV
uniref:Uncharacterized protein n=1 Tax=Cacopsylla melanoneura TaxID=428564 RepID=A0A8D9AJV4_9HEMI